MEPQTHTDQFSNILRFNVGNQAYALPLEHLVAAAGMCPYLTYAGIPKAYSGVVQWGGKLIPILNLSFFSESGSQTQFAPVAAFDAKPKNGTGSFAFAEINGRNIAIPISSDAHVEHPIKIRVEKDIFFPAVAINEEQQEARIVQLAKMLEKIPTN